MCVSSSFGPVLAVNANFSPSGLIDIEKRQYVIIIKSLNLTSFTFDNSSTFKNSLKYLQLISPQHYLFPDMTVTGRTLIFMVQSVHFTYIKIEK